MTLNPLIGAMLLAVASLPVQALDAHPLRAIVNPPVLLGDAVTMHPQFELYSFTLHSLGTRPGIAPTLERPGALTIGDSTAQLPEAGFMHASDTKPDHGFGVGGLRPAAHGHSFAGFAAGTQGGSSSASTPAPIGAEPASYALLLGGLGAAGFLAARRIRRD